MRDKTRRSDFEIVSIKKEAKEKITSFAEKNRVTVGSAVETAIYLFLDVCPDQIETILNYDAKKAARQLKQHIGCLRKIRYLQTK